MNNSSVSKSRIFGAILLVAGCCIGAGMLGLPVLSAPAGFKPSIFTFTLCWLFMLCTGLLVLEVHLGCGKDTNIVSMAQHTLGKTGKWISWLVFLFLFYSIIVAYVTASGSLISDFIFQLSGLQISPSHGSILCVLVFGALIFWGTQTVDWFNRVLMIGLFVTYGLLVITGASYIDSSLLERTNWSQATLVIPAAILSFGFHNLVPSISSYLNGNVRALKWTFIIGSLIPLVIYLIWEWLILGIVPIAEFEKALDHGEMATQALKTVVGFSWITDVAQIFAFFAIVTSLLGVALSFVDFLSDGLSIKKSPQGKVLLIALVLLPPLFFALMYPEIFLIALTYAGGFGAVILFGILPALMVWKGRYYSKNITPLVPGGKVMLTSVILFALWVILLQIL